MKPSPRRNLVILAGVVLLLVLMLVVQRLALPSSVNTETPTTKPLTVTSPAASAAPVSTPTAGTTPGLVIYGYVRSESGDGVGNVEIYRSYAGYPAVLIATTDTNGYYQSDFYPIPGDEMVTVYAQQTGLVFEPEFHDWRHYYGNERAERDFVARVP